MNCTSALTHPIWAACLFRSYDVTPDGKRFIMIKELPGPADAADTPQMNVVLNWSPDVKRHQP